MRNKTIYKAQPKQNFSTFISDRQQAKDKCFSSPTAKESFFLKYWKKREIMWYVRMFVSRMPRVGGTWKGEDTGPQPALLIHTNVNMA
jgi:hypothetical protein